MSANFNVFSAELQSSRENVFLPSGGFCTDGHGLNECRAPLSLYEPQAQELRGNRASFGQSALKSSRSHESLLGYAGANQVEYCLVNSGGYFRYVWNFLYRTTFLCSPKLISSFYNTNSDARLE